VPTKGTKLRSEAKPAKNGRYPAAGVGDELLSEHMKERGGQGRRRGPVPGAPAGRTLAAAHRVVGLVEGLGGAGWSFTPGPPERDAGDATTWWPLVLADGGLLGSVRHEPRSGADEGHDEAVVALLEVFADLVAVQQRAQRLDAELAAASRHALVDVLTGLLNRRGWEAELRTQEARLGRSGGSVVIAVVDVDGLKQVNDATGHLAGDLLLRTSAAALRAGVREADTVARTGGDEFAVLAVDWGGTLPDNFAARIDAALRAEGVPGSIGAGVREPGEPLALLSHRADLAMYRTKRSRRAATDRA